MNHKRASQLPDGIDVVQLIRAQHDRIRELSARVEAGDPTPTNLLLDELAMHLEVEEAVLYPALLETWLHERIRVSAEEHLSVKRVISDLVESDPRDDRFAARVTVLRRQAETHMEEEETELLPEVERLFDYDQRQALANEMTAFMHTLVENGDGGPLEAVLTDSAAPTNI